MNIKERLPGLLVVGFLAAGAAVMGYKFLGSSDADVTVNVKVPELSTAAKTGAVAFEKNCQSCHGVDAAGTKIGPPLIHDIYNPGHHGDGAFVAAARRGVKQHHWPYGNMPAQPQVTNADIAAIIRYVREVQRANGIFYKQHRM